MELSYLLPNLEIFCLGIDVRSRLCATTGCRKRGDDVSTENGSICLREGLYISTDAFSWLGMVLIKVYLIFFLFELAGDDSLLLNLLLLISVSNFCKCYYNRSLLYYLASMLESWTFANPWFLLCLLKFALVVIGFRLSTATIAGCFSGRVDRVLSCPCLLLWSGESCCFLNLALVRYGLNF